LGFFLACVTYLDGGRLAVVPAGTEARRDWRVEVAPSRVETREGLLLPRPADGHVRHLLPAGGPTTAGTLPAPEQPRVRIAANPYLGTWFLLTILVVFVSTHAPLRGIWQWVAVLAIALMISLVALYGWWGHIVDWFGLLHIQINMAGYLFLSTWLFAIWAVAFLYFDRLT
jgi:hypothetical protein